MWEGERARNVRSHYAKLVEIDFLLSEDEGMANDIWCSRRAMLKKHLE